MANSDEWFNRFVDDLKDDLTTYIKNVSKFAATAIRDEMDASAYKAIEAFYADKAFDGTSEPFWYDRHYYNFRKKSYQKYYHSNERAYVGGIKFTPANMDELYIHSTATPLAQHPTWGADAGFVFYKVMYEGWHGPISDGVRPMTPTPMEMIIQKRDEINKNIDKYFESAEAKAYKLRKYK